MFAHRPWPDEIRPYMEWFVHLADILGRGQDPEVLEVVDREIDIIIEQDLQTYRIIDLEDFGNALADGRISTQDADRLLKATQTFLDDYLHGGGKFPPEIVKEWLDVPLRPERMEP